MEGFLLGLPLFLATHPFALEIPNQIPANEIQPGFSSVSPVAMGYWWGPLAMARLTRIIIQLVYRNNKIIPLVIISMISIYLSIHPSIYPSIYLSIPAIPIQNWYELMLLPPHYTISFTTCHCWKMPMVAMGALMASCHFFRSSLLDPGLGEFS